jgi:ATP-dependent RNA circularization protein (DNA/RNA ligase family)
MTKPIGFFTSYTPGDGGLLQDMEESWGATFEALTPYQRAYLIAAVSTEIFSQYESEDNENDSEVEEVTERLGELGFGDLLGLMEALINQAKVRRG